METNKRARLTAYIVSGAWSLALFVAGVKVPGTASRVLGFLPLAVVSLFAVYDNWLWHRGALILLAKRPYLSGTWAGEFVSIRDRDGAGEKEYPPQPVYLAIRQSFIGLSIVLISAESCSYSVAEDLRLRVGDQFVLYYQYSNTPNLSLRPSSPEHSGGAMLSISGKRPDALTGEYWTNRGSRGTMSVNRLSGKHAGTWAEAQQLR